MVGTGELGCATFVVMATAIVVGVVAGAVMVVDGAGETSTMRAVLFALTSSGGSGFGGGLSP
jgi:hypothetical protein